MVYISPIVFALISMAIILWRRACAKAANPHHLRLPPGPGPLPIVGNILDFPLERPWEVYHSMAKTYGDVVYLNIMGQPIIVLGSLQSAVDLLEKRSAQYSDRLYSTMMSELMGFGNLWRRNRRAFHQQFMPPVAERHLPIQMTEARNPIRRVLHSPDKVFHHIRHTFAATMMMTAYGIKVLDIDDEYITIAEEALNGFSEVVIPGNFIVDLIPFLKYVPAWVPGAVFQQKAKHWRPYVIKMVEQPWQVVKDSLQAGTLTTPSIAQRLLDSLPAESNGSEEEHIQRNMLASAYGAGSDTTVSALEFFLLAMAIHPQIQVLAQNELDAVVGLGRLPTFDDRETLPYVNAIINEVLRWQPVTPLAVAHRASENDEYRGYFIPKGSVILPNAWAILHDPAVYPNPDLFDPARFLINGKLNSDVQDPRIACFGFGRRICPGRVFADNSLYAVIVSMLHVYFIGPAVDEYGSSIPIKVEMSSGVISHPKPFKCSIVPRSTAAAALIEYDESVH